MACMNALRVIDGVVNEQRLRIGALKFTVLYLSTVPAAVRGDVEPFVQVLGMPGT
jgi:hypothetical protein